jgi:hypothetical protein
MVGAAVESGAGAAEAVAARDVPVDDYDVADAVQAHVLADLHHFA